jgi:hypothetical protein
VKLAAQITRRRAEQQKSRTADSHRNAITIENFSLLNGRLRPIETSFFCRCPPCIDEVKRDKNGDERGREFYVRSA